jgi:hypothetical protein
LEKQRIKSQAGNRQKMGSGCDKQQRVQIIEPFPDTLQAREGSKLTLATQQVPSQAVISQSRSSAKDAEEPEAEEEL